jgi:hypothetical protein
LLLAREYRIANEEANTHNAQAQPAK